MLVSWTVVAGAIGLALKVTAHGLVTNYTVDGRFFHDYWDKHITWEEDNSPGPEWDTPGIGIHTTGFTYAPIFDSEFQSPDFVCHRGATPGRSSVTVGPGSIFVFQWPNWPRSHHGPIINMIASCQGSCHTVDKTTLKWNLLEKVGLIDPTMQNYTGETFQAGYWAADKLIDAGNKWTFRIPAGIAPGNYTLRHEIIALHNTYAGPDPNPPTPWGGQWYPNCFNIEMTGSGTDPLDSGTLSKDLYNVNEPGLVRNLWLFNAGFVNYTIPGPPVWTPSTSPSSTVGGGSNGGGTASTTITNSPSTTITISPPTAAVDKAGGDGGGCDL